MAGEGSLHNGSASFGSGDQVVVGRNDAHVAPGTTGTVIGVKRETGNVLVDVDGRGRVALLPSSLRRTGEESERKARDGEVEAQLAPGTVRVGPHVLVLSMASAELASALGLTQHKLRAVAEAAGLHASLGVGHQRFYTVGEIEQVWELLEAMREYGVPPKPAAKFLAHLKRGRRRSAS